jgi:hypothetical protein
VQYDSYADPYNCQCVYVGGPEEFARYQRLALRQQVADERLEAAEMANDAVMDWDMWGPFWW